jgi:transposase
MVINNTQYYNPENYLYLDEKRKLGLVTRIKKQIEKNGLKNEDFGFVTT